MTLVFSRFSESAIFDEDSVVYYVWIDECLRCVPSNVKTLTHTDRIKRDPDTHITNFLRPSRSLIYVTYVTQIVDKYICLIRASRGSKN
jgi:hypothetical protein